MDPVDLSDEARKDREALERADYAKRQVRALLRTFKGIQDRRTLRILAQIGAKRHIQLLAEKESE